MLILGQVKLRLQQPCMGQKKVRLSSGYNYPAGLGRILDKGQQGLEIGEKTPHPLIFKNIGEEEGYLCSENKTRDYTQFTICNIYIFKQLLFNINIKLSF